MHHRAPQDYDYLVKLVCVGDSGVGKSAMVRRFADDEFDCHGTHVATIGVDFRICSLNIDGARVKVQLWDTAGQERFRAITSSYYRGADGIVVAYDTTDQASFDNVPEWLGNVARFARENVPVMVVGTKTDLMSKRQVCPTPSLEDVRGMHWRNAGSVDDEKRFTFRETSSRTGAGVEHTIAEIAGQAVAELRARALVMEHVLPRGAKCTLGQPLTASTSCC